MALDDPSFTGLHLLRFRFHKVDNKPFYRGQIQEYLGLIEEACFLLKDDIKSKKVNLIACYEISRTVRTPNVINIRGFCRVKVEGSETTNKNCVVYDAYDDTYTSWAITHSGEMDSAWWEKQIVNLLDALHVMRCHRVYHGDLENPESYVIVGGNLSLTHFGIQVKVENVNVWEREQKKTPETKEFQHKQNDVNCLLRFLDSQVKKFPGTDLWLWEHFKNCSQNFSIGQLRKHPLFLTDLEKYRYRRVITDFVRNHMLDVSDFEKKLRLAGNKHFLHWSCCSATNFVFMKTFSHGKSEEVLDSVNLLRFMEKLLDHYEENAPNSVANREEVESSISNKYPEFLAVLHSVLVKLPNWYAFTEYYSLHLPEGG